MDCTTLPLIWEGTPYSDLFPLLSREGSLKTELDESFRLLGADKDNRLQVFSLTQNGPLDDYLNEFSRLSLMVSGQDDQSHALFFVRGLSANLRYKAMREHPRTVSEALRAARMAHRHSQKILTSS